MAEASKNPRRAELLTRGDTQTPRIHHTPRTSNQMLDKFLGFLLGPNDPNLAVGEIPFLPPAVRLFQAGKTVARMAPDVMEATYEANKAKDLEKIMERYKAEVVRPHDIPYGEVKEVAPKIMEISKPAGSSALTDINEVWRRIFYGR